MKLKKESKYALALYIVLGFSVFRFPKLLRMNNWSIKYMTYRVQTSDLSERVFQPISFHPRSYLWLARLELEKGNPAKALGLVQKRSEKRSVNAMRILADAWFEMGRFEDSINLYLKLNDDLALFEMGKRAVNTRNIDLARKAYLAAYKLDPEKYTIILADFYWIELGLISNSEEYLRHAIKDYPFSNHYTDWLVRLGDVLSAKKKYTEAQKIYQGVIEQSPNVTAAHIGLGWIYYENSQLTSAVNEFKKAIRLDPSVGDGYFALAQLYSKSKKYHKADYWYEFAISKDQKRVWWYILWANSNQASGDLPGAIEIYEQTVQEFSTFSPLYYELSWAYKLYEEPEKAKLAISTAIKLLDEPNADYYVRAALIEESIGNMKLAYEYFSEALRIEPSNRIAQKGISRVGGE